MQAVASLNYFLPSQQYSGLYDRMYGFELQYRSWFSPPFGFAVAGGMMKAKVNDDIEHIIKPSEATFSGTATMTPLGVSALYELMNIDDWCINAEAGLRYVFIDSKVDMEYRDQRGDEDVDMDDALVAVIRFNVDRILNDNFGLFAGFGIQLDLSPGDVSINGVDDTGNNLKGYSLSLGGKYTF